MTDWWTNRWTEKSYGSCHLHVSDDALYFYEASWKWLEWFSSYRVDKKMTIVKFQRRITPKIYREELRFLWSAHHLMMLYISMKFHDTFLKDFQVTEWTRNYYCQISKGNNSKNVSTRVTVFVIYTLSVIFLWSFMKISWTVFKL